MTTPSADGQGAAAVAVQAAEAVPASSSGGSGMVAVAKAELGVTEQPPGSNDSSRIAEYRTAVPGGPVGPWCAYFASWVSAQNGHPLGERGQGFARVDDVWSWAERSGRALRAGPGVTPQPGDLIVWDEHIGVVDKVRPDGTIETIEGNSGDHVAQRVYPPGSSAIVGFVRVAA
jgi:hypothetical protein